MTTKCRFFDQFVPMMDYFRCETLLSSVVAGSQKPELNRLIHLHGPEVRATLKMTESFFRLIEAENAVDYWLHPGRRDGADKLQQSCTIAHGDIAKTGAASLELKEIDAGVFRTQKADGCNFAAKRHGAKGLIDGAGSSDFNNSVHTPAASECTDAFTPLEIFDIVHNVCCAQCLQLLSFFGAGSRRYNHGAARAGKLQSKNGYAAASLHEHRVSSPYENGAGQRGPGRKVGTGECAAFLTTRPVSGRLPLGLPP